MKRSLFAEIKDSGSATTSLPNKDKLIEIQAKALVEEYHTTCFSVKQIQKVLGIGETNTYKLIRSGRLPSQVIGRRRVVPVAAIANFLIVGM